MAKKQVPECSIIPGMLTGIDYKELIKRDASNVCDKFDVLKKEQPKMKVYSKKKIKIR